MDIDIETAEVFYKEILKLENKMTTKSQITGDNS